MRKFVFSVVFFCLLGLSVTPTLAAYKDEYKLDIVPAISTAWGKGAQYFADLVKELTDGRINIKVYPGAQLTTGKQTNAFMLLRSGAIDFAVQSSINWSPQVVELNLFALPFFIASQPDRYKAMDAITSGKSGAMLKKAVEDKGVVILAYGENGFRELTNSKKEIRKPEDLSGLKMRVVGSPIFLDTFKALGANPVTMNWSDTMAALQQGVVDGQENPIATFYPVKVYEYNKYLTDWHYVIDPTLFAVNPKVWGSFTDEDKKIIEQAAIDAAAFQKALARVGLDDGASKAYLEGMNKPEEVVDWYATLKDAGMVISVLTPEETAMFVEKTTPVLEEWKGKIGDELVKAAEADMAGVK